MERIAEVELIACRMLGLMNYLTIILTRFAVERQGVGDVVRPHDCSVVRREDPDPIDDSVPDEGHVDGDRAVCVGRRCGVLVPSPNPKDSAWPETPDLDLRVDDWPNGLRLHLCPFILG